MENSPIPFFEVATPEDLNRIMPFFLSVAEQVFQVDPMNEGRGDTITFWARTAIVVELCKMGYSLSDVGRKLRKHHATVINMRNKHKTDVRYCARYKDLYFNFSVLIRQKKREIKKEIIRGKILIVRDDLRKAGFRSKGLENFIIETLNKS